MKRVNFFLVGQPKSGTTALYTFLSGHPEVHGIRPKEPHIFCSDIHRSADAYLGDKLGHEFFPYRGPEGAESLITPSTKERIICEACTNYLYSQTAAEEIYAYNPEAKIAMILREPVSFLFSLYHQYRNETAEQLMTFEEALNAENDRKLGKLMTKRVRCPLYLYYMDRIQYAEQIQRYRNLFPPEHIRIYFFDDFVKDNATVYYDLVDFLGIDTSYTPDFRSIHKGKTPRFPILNKFLRSPYLKSLPKLLLPGSLYDSAQLRVQDVLMKNESRTDTILPETQLHLQELCIPAVSDLSTLLDVDLIKKWNYN